MDGVYPSSVCQKLPIKCDGNKTISYTGGTWASTAYIRGRGQTSFATEVYDEGWPDYLTNNPPPTIIYVRVAPSQYDATKMVYWINGWQQPRLLLTAGKKYQFNVSACGNPFYLTTDPTGGQGNKGNLTSLNPSDFFTTTLTVNPNLPREFYYQCSNFPGMGGRIKVI